MSMSDQIRAAAMSQNAADVQQERVNIIELEQKRDESCSILLSRLANSIVNLDPKLVTDRMLGKNGEHATACLYITTGVPFEAEIRHGVKDPLYGVHDGYLMWDDHRHTEFCKANGLIRNNPKGLVSVEGIRPDDYALYCRTLVGELMPKSQEELFIAPVISEQGRGLDICVSVDPIVPYSIYNDYPNSGRVDKECASNLQRAGAPKQQVTLMCGALALNGRILELDIKPEVTPTKPTATPQQPAVLAKLDS